MAEKNPNKLYDGMKSLQDDLESIKSMVSEINETAKSLMNDANEFGGVVAKVFKEQMAKYFIPAAQKISEPIDALISGDRVPGSLKDLTLFLDSVPLAMVRQEPTVSELAAPVTPENVDLATPAESSKVENPVDEVPMNASYANGTDEPVQESKKRPHYTNFREGFKKNSLNESKEDCDVVFSKDGVDVVKCINNLTGDITYAVFDGNNVLSDRLKSIDKAKDLAMYHLGRRLTESKEPEGITKYQVVRSSKVGSELGEDIANIDALPVAEFDNKEDADLRAEELNGTILPEEKELLGTEYKVEKKVIEKSDPEPYKEPKDIKK